MNTLTLSWASAESLVCLKITHDADGRPVLEAWDGLWRAARETMVAESDQVAREYAMQLLAKRRACLLWDTTLEAQDVPAVAEKAAEGPVTLRTLADFLASADCVYSTTVRAIEYLGNQVSIGDLRNAVNYANREAWRARRMEDSEVKTEYKALLDGFLRLVKQIA